jgi:hypothetical protein
MSDPNNCFACDTASDEEPDSEDRDRFDTALVSSSAAGVKDVDCAAGLSESFEALAPPPSANPLIVITMLKENGIRSLNIVK